MNYHRLTRPQSARIFAGYAHLLQLSRARRAAHLAQRDQAAAISAWFTSPTPSEFAALKSVNDRHDLRRFTGAALTDWGTL